jgi:hypothetical protein
MPIVEADPWREQYFEGVKCPDDVVIPTDDPDSYRLYPQYRWIYNKLLIAETQNLVCGPHGIIPDSFPVFSKPIYNLRGMGLETRIFHDREEYLDGRDPGHMWMPLFEGEHVSSDLAVVQGEVRWCRHTKGVPLENAMFDYWTVLAESKPDLENYQAAWVKENFAGYTGMINTETIGGRIIEAHLRFADQWPDLYGTGWVDSLVDLYANHRWNFDDRDRRDGYSVVLFGPHGANHRKPDAALQEEIRTTAGIASLQITFHEDKPLHQHAMPPGGFRLAIVNCWDLDAGIAARERLALHFWATQTLRPRSRRRPRRDANR